MSLGIYNTMGRAVEEFLPFRAGKAGFYGCGPTVYNYAHIGNLRAYVSHDILTRLLRRRAYDVTHVMNITDVGHLSGDNDEGDDKMLRSAGERGKSVLEIAEFYTRAFFNDTGRLNIRKPDVVCKATDHIDEMIELIKRIEAGGFTYFSGGNLYFDISKFPSYGALARLKAEDIGPEGVHRVEADGNKRNPRDFVLWFTKSKFENHALVWDSPWGRGYPGWHIECSAMSMKYLGEQFDIHAGGIDHIQIHHSNEIAQSEAATGKHPWVKYWFHNEFLVLDKGKMSKSSGSFITLQNLIDEGYSPLDYRFFLLGGHYRSQLQFSYESLSGARNARRSLISSLKCAAQARGGQDALKAREYINQFDEALDDDISTPKAMAALWMLIKDNSVQRKALLDAAFEMDTVFALDLEKEVFEGGAKNRSGMTEAEIISALERRAQAKKSKDFAAADSIRDELKRKGIIIEDGREGTIWRFED